MKPEDSISSSRLNINPQDRKCAPHLKFEDGHCAPLEILVNLAEAYNKQYTENKIQLSSKLHTLNPKKYKKYLVYNFQDRLNNVCDDQKCWIKQDFTRNMNRQLKSYLKKKVFRPDAPQGKFTWLNTFNINEVLCQYEHKYKDFKFLGAVPSDFAELNGLTVPGMDVSVSNLDLAELENKGIHRIGMVFNLDEHNKSGSHWVSLYANLKSGGVYFSDSYGVAPEKRFRAFMRKIARYVESKGIEPDVRHNRNQHQYKGSECGVYSINFITRQLNGESFDEVSGKLVHDNEMNQCRDTYFSK